MYFYDTEYLRVFLYRLKESSHKYPCNRKYKSVKRKSSFTVGKTAMVRLTMVRGGIRQRETKRP